MNVNAAKKGKSWKNVRPTSGKVLLALFNILKSAGCIDGADFLDLFAGTGEVSVAALRNGARSAVAVEADRECAAYVALRLSQFGASATCVCRDVRRALPKLAGDGTSFGVIFADPPYGMGWGVELPKIIEKNISVLAPGGVFVFERSSREEISEISLPREDRIYGETVLSFYRNEIQSTQQTEAGGLSIV